MYRLKGVALVYVFLGAPVDVSPRACVSLSVRVCLKVCACSCRVSVRNERSVSRVRLAAATVAAVCS